MAIGDEMVLEGRLLLTNFGIGIELDDETIWHLDVTARVQSFIGQQVKVRGIQSAFDRLRVELIERR